MNSKTSSYGRQRTPRSSSLLAYKSSLEAVREPRQTVAARLWRRSPLYGGGGRQAEIVDQSKALCGRYLRGKLLKTGTVPNKKLGLQRLKSISNLSAMSPQGWSGCSRVVADLRMLCRRLETGPHAHLFESVVANVGLRKLPTEAGVRALLEAVIRELFRHEITWGRVVAMYCVAGALAIDCVKWGRTDFVLGLVETVGTFVERDLSPWIQQQGGWESMMDHSRRRRSKGKIVAGLLFLLSLFLFFVFNPNNTNSHS